MNVDLRFEPAPTHPWRSRWHRWLFNRLKAHDTHPLTLHNVYVLPTQAGWMMLATTAVLMLATINYQLNLAYVLIFLLMGAGVVGLALAHRAMTRITLSLDTSRALCGVAGEDVTVAIQVVSPHTTSLHHLTLQWDAIGSQPLPLLTCDTRYPLGLLRLWTVWRLQSHVQIEAPKAIPNAASPSDAPAPLDSIKDDFRAYRVGDAPRDLLWKSVAKRPDSPAAWGVRERDAHSAQLEAPAAARQAAVQPIRPADQDQPSLQSLLQKRDQLLLCVLLVISLPFFLHLALWYPLMASVLISIRLWLSTQPTRQAYQWLQLPLIAGLGGLVWLQFRTLSGIEPSVSACLGLLGIKALELPRNPSHKHFSRDRWVLVFLGLFTLAAHFLMSQSLLSSVWVVLGLIGLLYVLVDAHSSVQLKAKLTTTAALVVLGAPIMLVLFFLFPRFAPLWTLGEQTTTALSGLSSDMRVGDISQISLNSRIVLRMAVETPAKLDSQDIYLRGPVLTSFDGRTWTTYLRGSSVQKLPPIELDWEGTPTVSYTIFEEPKRPEGPLKAQTNVRTSAAIRNDAQSTRPIYLQHALVLPAQSNPRTQQWLRSLRQDARYAHFAAQDWSALLLQLFKTGGFRYSLEPGPFGEHMVDELLFDRATDQKLGFCEHYASSYVIAMRMLGVPARIVTGYQGAEINPMDGLFVVRNSHAHAWAEYWDSSLGWQRADPTAVIAPARIHNAHAFNQAPEQAIARKGQTQWPWLASVFTPAATRLWQLRLTWEATSHAFETWMQNYDQGTQMAWLKHLGFDSPSWRDLVQLLNAAVIALLCLGTIIYARQGKRSVDPWLALLQAARNKALRAGLTLAPHATPQAIAQALPHNWPKRDLAIAWLMQLERARYDNQQAHADHLTTLKRSFKTDFHDFQNNASGKLSRSVPR